MGGEKSIKSQKIGDSQVKISPPPDFLKTFKNGVQRLELKTGFFDIF